MYISILSLVYLLRFYRRFASGRSAYKDFEAVSIISSSVSETFGAVTGYFSVFSTDFGTFFSGF